MVLIATGSQAPIKRKIMSNTLHTDLGNVFSIMPQSEAVQALDDLVDGGVEHNGEFSSNIK